MRRNFFPGDALGKEFSTKQTCCLAPRAAICWTIGQKIHAALGKEFNTKKLVAWPPELQFAGPSARKFTLLLERSLAPKNLLLGPRAAICWTIGQKIHAALGKEFNTKKLVAWPPELQFAGPSARKFTLLLERSLTPKSLLLGPQSCNLLDQRPENPRCSWKGVRKFVAWPTELQFAGPSARKFTLLWERSLTPKNLLLGPQSCNLLDHRPENSRCSGKGVSHQKTCCLAPRAAICWTIGQKIHGALGKEFNTKKLVAWPPELQFAGPSARKFTLLWERSLTPKKLVAWPPELQFAGPSARKFTLLWERSLTPTNLLLGPQSCNLLDHRPENSRCSGKGV